MRQRNVKRIKWRPAQCEQRALDSCLAEGLVSFEEIDENEAQVEQDSNQTQNSDNASAEKADMSTNQDFAVYDRQTQNSDDDSAEKAELSPNQDFDVSAWQNFKLHASLYEGIKDLKFGTPTEVQSHALLAGIRDCLDVIGAAETVHRVGWSRHF